jgi:hypothetical protein
MRMMLAEKAEDWEEDLVEQHALDPVERARVDKILETINAYAAMRIEVEGDRPSAGDTCHLVVATRAAVLDDPQIAQGAAGVRRGKAVWQFSFEAAGTYADDIKAHVTEVLRILDERSEPFRGLDPSPPLVLP